MSDVTTDTSNIKAEDSSTATTPKNDDVILEIANISVSFDGFKALNDLSMKFMRNELRCIIGPNGAGKTTMMDRPDEGTCTFNNTVDLSLLTEAEIALVGIGRKFQKPTIFESHTVFENLELAMKTDKTVFFSLFAVVDDVMRDRISDTLKKVNLGEHADQLAGRLSHGQKQWLEIGMLLMQDPQLLLLDEPVAGMTDDETERTGELFNSLKGKHSLVVVEHDMDFVAQLKSMVTVLDQGSMLCEGEMAAVQADPRVIEVYLGR
jgi:urea transport system ATP-binding protein